jgi:ATP-dependent Clp protease ATP-binding subunit ClpA
MHLEAGNTIDRTSGIDTQGKSPATRGWSGRVLPTCSIVRTQPNLEFFKTLLEDQQNKMQKALQEMEKKHEALKQEIEELRDNQQQFALKSDMSKITMMLEILVAQVPSEKQNSCKINEQVAGPLQIDPSKASTNAAQNVLLPKRAGNEVNNKIQSETGMRKKQFTEAQEDCDMEHGDEDASVQVSNTIT